MNDRIVPSGKVLLQFKNVNTGELVEILVPNLVTDAGKASIASRLKGSTTSGLITYCALGTDATAPASANTDLGTELGRKLISVRSVATNVATFQTFFTTSEVNGVLKEAGLFGDDATASADTGTLFCHTAVNRTKTSAETLTLTWTVTIG